jgi:hypothetical protein
MQVNRTPDHHLKTSVRVLGADQVDEFRALAVLLGRRPHELAADMVLDGIRRYRQDPDVGPRVVAMVQAARAYRLEHEAPAEPTRGFRLIQGGGQ